MDYIHANYPLHLIRHQFYLEDRGECVDRLIEIALCLDKYLGVSRLFVP